MVGHLQVYPKVFARLLDESWAGERAASPIADPWLACEPERDDETLWVQCAMAARPSVVPASTADLGLTAIVSQTGRMHLSGSTPPEDRQGIRPHQPLTAGGGSGILSARLLNRSAALADGSRLARIFKALSVDTRVRMVQLLKQQSLCVNALAARLEITPAAVSQHLRILRDADLVTPDKRGYYVHYEVNQKTLAKWRAVIDKLLAPSPAEGARPKKGAA